MKSVIDVYHDIAIRNKVWTPQEEKDAIKKLYNKKNNSKFVNEALKHNLWLVFKVVDKYPFAKGNEDVFQSAVIGLSDALKSYDPKKGMKISTWVYRSILWAVLKHQHPYSRRGLIADDIKSLNRKYNTNMGVIELDRECDFGGKDFDGKTISDIISPETANVDYIRIRGIRTFDDETRQSDIKEGVYELIYGRFGKKLTNREKFVIEMLYLGLTQAEISKEMNVTRMRVSQLVNGAFEKIRKSKDGKKLKELVM